MIKLSLKGWLVAMIDSLLLGNALAIYKQEIMIQSKARMLADTQREQISDALCNAHEKVRLLELERGVLKEALKEVKSQLEQEVKAKEDFFQDAAIEIESK